MDQRYIDRFCGDGVIILGKVQQKLAVLTYIERNVPQDLSSLRTLQTQEFNLETNYRAAWNDAKEVYLERKRNPSLYAQVCGGGHPEEYHIALIAYTLEHPKLYKDFNAKTRDLVTAEDFRSYPYKSYFAFLLLAVKNVTGKPQPMRPTQQLYRGVTGNVDRAVVGNSVIFQHFVSTTRSEKVAQRFISSANKMCVLFVIDGVRAGEMYTAMDDHSYYTDQEQEVLVWPYEGYIITKVEKSGNQMRIYLKP